MKKITWIIIIVVIVLGLVAVRMKRVHEKNSAPLVTDVPVAVRVAPVTRDKVVRTRHVLGAVFGADEAEIAPRVMASVMNVAVREGDRVTKDQLLLDLDSRELRDGVVQAEAGVAAAREGLSAAEIMFNTQHDATQRDLKLYKAKAISQEKWDRSRSAEAAAAARSEAARAQLQVAQKKLDQARTRLSYTRITAPFDGVVSRRLVDPGDLAAPGHPLLKMVRQNTVRVRAQVPPEDFPSLKPGIPVTITHGATTVTVPVSRVFPAMDRSRLATIEADLDTPPPGFVAGATVGVDIALGAAEGLAVPADALLEGEKGAWVFTIRDEKIHVVPVKVMDHSFTQAVVTGDLQETDRVVTARPSRLMTFYEGLHAAPVNGE